MTPLQRYIAEEIAIDHADGLLSRREALRRLGLSASAWRRRRRLLAACATDDAGEYADVGAGDTRAGPRRRHRDRPTPSGPKP